MAAEKIQFGINDAFEEFIYDWNSKFYLLTGGYGSSKSYHVAVKIITKLIQEKRKCLVVREVYETIRDSCYSLLTEVIECMGLDIYVKCTLSPMGIKFKNGSEIIFKGMDRHKCPCKTNLIR